MNDETLFVHQVDELARLCQLGPAAQHESLRIAAIVRQLLLDDTRLVDVVNRSRRVKLVFTVSDETPPTGVIGWDPTEILDPGSGLGATVALNRDQFLKRTALVWQSKEFSVRDVVKFFANSEGGVHLEPDVSSDADKTLLRQFRQAAKVSGPKGQHPSLVYNLAAIGRIVVVALDPLKQDILKDLSIVDRRRLGH